MGRHRSTISRELRRNCSRHDGAYRFQRAQEQANARRSHSRRKSHFTTTDWALIESMLRERLSPEQISGRLRATGRLDISHETIYLRIWRDKRRGGRLYRHFRRKQKYRKRYGTNEKRGRLAGKRHITERPASVELRRKIGHWEVDTVSGSGSKHCIVTVVERVTGHVLIGKLRDHTVPALNKRAIQLIAQHRPFSRPSPQTTAPSFTDTKTSRTPPA